MNGTLFLSDICLWNNIYLERLYYQYDPARISTCPVLSMPSCILLTALRQWDRSGVTGPFPWSGIVANCNLPFGAVGFHIAPLDRFVLESAQLTQLQTLYNLHDELALWPPHRGKILGSFQNEFCKSPVLLTLSTL